MPNPLFPLGIVTATPAALEHLAEHEVTHADLLHRHVVGDWGDLCEEDKESNNFAVNNGLRLLSSYPVGTGTIWIITEADRSVTTPLLPSDY